MILPGLRNLGGNPLPFLELGVAIDQTEWHRKQPDGFAVLLDAGHA
jgi:hypothetical protein